jgi:hypothetical protein
LLMKSKTISSLWLDLLSVGVVWVPQPSCMGPLFPTIWEAQAMMVNSTLQVCRRQNSAVVVALLYNCFFILNWFSILF